MKRSIVSNLPATELRGARRAQKLKPVLGEQALILYGIMKGIFLTFSQT
jgi:hypothetical protein